MVTEYKVETAHGLLTGKVTKTYKRGSPNVAVKDFLNYLRRYRKDMRPTVVQITRVEDGTRWVATVTWYQGELAEGTFAGTQGEWYQIQEVKLVE